MPNLCVLVRFFFFFILEILPIHFLIYKEPAHIDRIDDTIGSTIIFNYIFVLLYSLAGNIASEYSELGRYGEEDRCCREHDLCPNTLSPGECKRGLCNTQQFTRSHCDCDTKFRKCLQGLNTGKCKKYNTINYICTLFKLQTYTKHTANVQ